MKLIFPAEYSTGISIIHEAPSLPEDVEEFVFSLTTIFAIFYLILIRWRCFWILSQQKDEFNYARKKRKTLNDWSCPNCVETTKSAAFSLPGDSVA